MIQKTRKEVGAKLSVVVLWKNSSDYGHLIRMDQEGKKTQKMIDGNYKIRVG